MVIPQELIERFNSYLKRNDSGCLLYNGGKVRDGYGWFNAPAGLPKQAHRFAFLVVNGTIDPTLMVCHTCDTPNCCESEHLFQATGQVNMDDMSAKGRSPNNKGSANPNSKLTDKQVLEIRKIKSTTTSRYVDIAPLFNVTPEMVSLICRRKYRNDI